MRYTSCPSVDPKHGIWAATGINAANVGMTATETTTSNPRVLAADPMVELREAKDGEEERCGGIGEEDIVVLVLPYIRSAREGVLRLGALLEQYGTYAVERHRLQRRKRGLVARDHRRAPLDREENSRGSRHHQPEPVWYGLVRFGGRLRCTGIASLLGRPQRIHLGKPSGSESERKVQPAGYLRLAPRHGSHLQHAARVVHGPLPCTAHLPLGRRKRGLHARKR